MTKNSSQSGAALLSILLIVATLSVAALIATEAIARQTDLQKLSSHRSTASWAARSAEAAALASANGMISASRLPISGYEAERVRTFTLPLEGGRIVVSLQEQAPCLNVNALGSTDANVRLAQAEAMVVLLEDLGVPTGDTATLVATLSDWIDTDSEEQPNGAEASFYAARNSALRPANQPLRSLRELSALPGFTDEVVKTVSAFGCAVEGAEPLRLNVNALSAESAIVLRAMTGGAISLSEARRFIDATPATGWKSLDDVNQYATSQPVLAQTLNGIPLSVQGAYFEGRGQVELDSGNWPFEFVVRAEKAGSSAVVWRSFGENG